MCSAWDLFRVRQCWNTAGARTEKVLEHNKNARRNARKQCWNTAFLDYPDKVPEQFRAVQIKELQFRAVQKASRSNGNARRKCWNTVGMQAKQTTEMLQNHSEVVLLRGVYARIQ